MPAVGFIIPIMNQTMVLDRICAHMLGWSVALPLLRDGAADFYERPGDIESIV